MANKKKKEKKHVRDFWIFNSWTYNGAGLTKNKKKIIERKMKYKRKIDEI